MDYGDMPCRMVISRSFGGNETSKSNPQVQILYILLPPTIPLFLEPKQGHQENHTPLKLFKYQKF